MNIGKRKVSQSTDITFFVFDIDISDNNYKNLYCLNNCLSTLNSTTI